jgi:hypothetical protein
METNYLFQRNVNSFREKMYEEFRCDLSGTIIALIISLMILLTLSQLSLRPGGL